MKSFLKHCIVYILTWEAKILLRRTNPKIVAITGSVGKTSMKDVVYEVLKGSYRVRKSEKSYNSEIGVPLTILGLPNAASNIYGWIKNIIEGIITIMHPGMYPEILVLELGVDHPGDMENFMKWITPDVAVLTRLPDIPVHVEFFDSPEAVSTEKIKLIRALRPQGVFVFNNDDEEIVRVSKEIFQQSIGYSRFAQAPFRVSHDAIVYEHGVAIGYSFKLNHLEESTNVRVHGSIGLQHAYTAAGAAAVASIFNIPISRISDIYEQFTPAPGRMRLLCGLKNTLIIDDSYNASPAAVEHALITLHELKGVKRRIAVLGDMMELGQFSIREHERIGRLVQKYANVLVTIGVRARGLSKGALEAGMSEANIFEFDDAVTAGRELQTFIAQGDVILIKASQSIRAERCTYEIMAEPERAQELLPRQDTFWKDR